MKIYGIGLSKTGTTSFNDALIMLGYRAEHNPDHLLYISDGILKLDMAPLECLDSISDIEAALYYKELDQKFPNSKFVLTTRNVEDWLSSCENHMYKTPKSAEMQELYRKIYGSSVFNRDCFRSAFENHEFSVNFYFKDRPNDLLILDVSDRDKWGKLCGFLDLLVPSQPYPRANVSTRIPHSLKAMLRRSPTIINTMRSIKKALRG